MTAPPYLISWNLTKRCNLLCGHCYLDSSELGGSDTLTREKAFSIVDQAASLAPGAMLVLTGGEPLLRPDIFDIINRAAARRLNPVLGTNGTLVTRETARGLLDAGIQGVGVSLDSCSPAFHDRFRGKEGAWEKTIKGIRALKAFDIPFQLQFTLTKGNRGEVDSAVALAIEHGATAVNFFFLVCTGRGQKAADLSPSEYEKALEDIVQAEAKYGTKTMVRARCAPHIVRVAERINPESPLAKGGTCGCIAGKGYLRISPEGNVTPCPYIPAADGSPNILETPLKEIWEGSPAFVQIRGRTLSGRCAGCEFEDSCGGCRARALALTGDVMGEDPWCVHEPKKEASPARTVSAPCWSPEARERLDKVPVFLRPMIKKGVEGYAASKGIDVITPELMSELRQRTGK